MIRRRMIHLRLVNVTIPPRSRKQSLASSLEVLQALVACPKYKTTTIKTTCLARHVVQSTESNRLERKTCQCSA
jgi:hypothetical protein